MGGAMKAMNGKSLVPVRSTGGAKTERERERERRRGGEGRGRGRGGGGAHQ